MFLAPSQLFDRPINATRAPLDDNVIVDQSLINWDAVCKKMRQREERLVCVHEFLNVRQVSRVWRVRSLGA